MGVEYLHFLAPKSLEWKPDADLVFRVDATLRELGLVDGDAILYDMSRRTIDSPRTRSV